jgi:signal transduction histidine kinase
MRVVRLRLPLLAGITALVATLATLVVVLVPSITLAYREPGLDVLIETLAGVVALLAAFLLLGRFRSTGRLDALVLAAALFVLSATNLVLGAAATAIQGEDVGGLANWAALLGRLVGDLALVAAAFVPLRTLHHKRRPAALALGGAALAFVAVVVAGWLLAPVAPDLVSLDPEGFGFHRLQAHPVLVAVQLLTMFAYAAAAVSFARRARLLDDGLLGVLAIVTLLGVFSRLHYALEPSLYSGWVYTGDGFRLVACLVLLAGVFREIGHSWESLAETAALRERRRFARDVHDGVAQELAYIVREGRRTELSPEILAAAERGLDESRRAIATLRRPVDEPLSEAIVHATSDIAGRSGARIEFVLSDQVDLPWYVRNGLVRIAMEAVVNATRHGRAHSIRISLEAGRKVRLRILDDGDGFDPEVVGRGFGLVTMRERAESVGGRLSIRSAPGTGTEVEVTV